MLMTMHNRFHNSVSPCLSLRSIIAIPDVPPLYGSCCALMLWQAAVHWAIGLGQLELQNELQKHPLQDEPARSHAVPLPA